MIRSYSSLLTWLGLTIAASLALYHTSDRVNELDQQLRGLNAQIESEQESTHVLKAEWVYLANPARVEAEVKDHLNLQPTAPRRVAALRDIGDLLPLHDGVEPVQPIQTAAAVPVRVHPAPKPVAQTDVPHTKYDRVIASLNAGRINDHMLMQHSAATQAPTDKIGALIGTLGLNP
ncbi:MAG: hypothetical protein WCD70_11495 [Alphaproteobacteria bacterium]